MVALPVWVWWIAVVVGCLKTVQLLKDVIRNIFPCFRRRPYRWTGLGKWAVVTGGTDGIGKAYVHEFAARGFGVCIVSRNLDKLKTVAREIDEKYQVSVETIHADFAEGPDIYDVIGVALDELQGGIGVLVNNVGMSYKYPEYFHQLPGGAEALHRLISTNATACTMMMRQVLPRMLGRGGGVIINVSSLLAVYPMPLLAVYAASKAYVDYVSRALQYEYQGRGILIQSLLPGYVATKMSHRKPSLEVPSPEQFVSQALQTVGHESCSYGYLPHKIRGFVHEWLRANMPTRVNMAIAMHFMSKGRQGYFRKRKNQTAMRPCEVSCSTKMQ